MVQIRVQSLNTEKPGKNTEKLGNKNENTWKIGENNSF